MSPVTSERKCIGSLSEMATVTAAAAGGDAALAVNNLRGGVAMQVAILAVADAVIGKGALSSIVARRVVLLQGTLCVFLLVLVVDSLVLLVVYVGGVLLLYRLR